MTTRKILISNEYLRLCKNIDNILDKSNILPNIIRYYYLYIRSEEHTSELQSRP